MRLIDADALKKVVNKKQIVGRFNMLLLIDNAPTVETSIEHFVDMKQINKCANCDLMLIEKSKRCKE